MTDVLTSPVDADRIGRWERLAEPPGRAFLALVVIAVLASCGVASWPGLWLPGVLPVKALWIVVGGIWLARLALAVSAGAQRNRRWLAAPAVVAAGALVVASGLPLMLRVALTSESLSRAVRAQAPMSDAGRLRQQCAHGSCLNGSLVRTPVGARRPTVDLGIYLNVRDSVTAQALVWHPGGKPTYLPCGISGFQHVYGPWYVAKTAHVDCLG